MVSTKSEILKSKMKSVRQSEMFHFISDYQTLLHFRTFEPLEERTFQYRKNCMFELTNPIFFGIAAQGPQV